MYVIFQSYLGTRKYKTDVSRKNLLDKAMEKVLKIAHK